MGQLCSGKPSAEDLSIDRSIRQSKNPVLSEDKNIHYVEGKIGTDSIEKVKEDRQLREEEEEKKLSAHDNTVKKQKLMDEEGEEDWEDEGSEEDSKQEEIMIPRKNKEFLEEQCIICLETFKDLGEEPSLTICGHCFCRKCLVGALKIKPYCPLCRKFQPRKIYQDEEEGLDTDDDQPSEEPLADDWNVDVVRAQLTLVPDENGYRRVVLSDGEATNVFVGEGAKINIAPGANLIINGKRIENPQDCNVQ